jgi:dipeptidyl aminopeptidase/acylaminoacyl peptidase
VCMCFIRRVIRSGVAALVGLLALALPISSAVGGSSAAADQPQNGPISFTGENGTIYEISPRGGVLHTLAHSSEGDYEWSPDGQQIAFDRTEENCDECSGLYVVGADGAGLLRLGSYSGSPAWSPDGHEIAFVDCETDSASSKDCAIFAVESNGTGLRRLTAWGAQSHPIWSPDGKLIAFSAVYGGKAQCKRERASGWVPEGPGEPLSLYERLYVVPATGGPLRRLTQGRCGSRRCRLGAGIESGAVGALVRSR